MSPSKIIASIAWCCLASGLCFRKIRTFHMFAMILGIMLDISLVLYLAITRNAVQTAMSFTLDTVSQLHILASTVALLLYFPVLCLGFTLAYRVNAPTVKNWHVKIALTAFLLRTLGFVLMFFVESTRPI